MGVQNCATLLMQIKQSFKETVAAHDTEIVI